MGNVCIGSCCNIGSNSESGQGRCSGNSYSEPSPVYPTERSGYHPSLAKMDSAPSSSVVGVNHVNPAGMNHHYSEANLLKIHNHHVIEPSMITTITQAAPRKSFVCRIPPLYRSGSSETKHGSEAKITSFFEKYRDKDRRTGNSCHQGTVGIPGSSHSVTEDSILSEGTKALCYDLDLKPDDFRVLVFAWKCDADRMCHFTRAQFMRGCRALKADSIRGLQAKLPEAAAELAHRDDAFKDLYRFTFRFGLQSTAMSSLTSDLGGNSTHLPRNLPLDMAMILWQLVFFPREPPILKRWLHFLQTHPIVGIPCDTWNMFLNFCDVFGQDLSAYDDCEAWPSLFDDFVEFETDKANQNYSAPPPKVVSSLMNNNNSKSGDEETAE